MAVCSIAGCETLDNFLAAVKSDPEVVAVPIDQRPVQDPIDGNTFTLATAEQTVIGKPQIVVARAEDTFSDLARTYGLGYDDLIDANPGIDPWQPGEGTAVLLPTQYVLPNMPKHGVILNIATKRLFYFPPSSEGDLPQVLTYPIGIGRVGWETPLGETTVVAKARNPSWWVPASVRREHAEKGDPLPSLVPPGPDNPLGSRVLKLDMPGYLIHGTNQPYGVGMRVSHGCVRLYPENIDSLYPLVEIGERVTIINEPYQIGRKDGVVYFEAHTPLEDDSIPAEDRLLALLDAQVDADGLALDDRLKQHIVSLSVAAGGVPVSIIELDSNEMLARADVVHNIVVPNPNELTRDEVRALMDEARVDDDT